MTRSPIAATIIVVTVLVTVPVALVGRLADGVLPTQAYDIVLVLGVLAWVFIAKAILERDNELTSLVENRLSPTWQANRLVEHSVLGVGLTGRATAADAAPRLHRVHLPLDSIDALLPEPIAPTGSGRGELHDDEVGPVRPQPTLRRPEQAPPPFTETEDYVVQRGDTFWSIAEQRLGSGRHWKAIEDVNVDREVAPGVWLRAGDTLRIGWTVLVPLVDEAVPVA